MNNKQLTVFALASALTVPMMLSGGSSALAATFGNDSLQNLLNDITVSGPGIDTVNDQTRYDKFTSTATGNSTSSLMFEFAELDPNSKFGIYSAKKPDQKVLLFDGANYEGAGSTVYFSNDRIAVWTGQFDPNGGGLVFDPPPNVERYNYSWNKYRTIFYTQDGLNGYEQAVVYRGDDETVLDLSGSRSGTFTDNEFIIAFEDEWLGGISDSDYDNFVVMVESIESVPEFGRLAGLGVVAALCIAMIRRRSPVEERNMLQRFTPARPTTFAKVYRKDNNNFIDKSTQQLKIATEYFSLAILPELSDAEADRLEEILELAQFDDHLSSLINKIDCFVLKELKCFEPDELERDNNQIARIKEFLVS